MDVGSQSGGVTSPGLTHAHLLTRIMHDLVVCAPKYLPVIGFRRVWFHQVRTRVCFNASDGCVEDGWSTEVVCLCRKVSNLPRYTLASGEYAPP
jgi:hypothetical protein